MLYYQLICIARNIEVIRQKEMVSDENTSIQREIKFTRNTLDMQ